MTTLDAIDQQILDTIRRVRARNQACTAGAVAGVLHITKDLVVRRCARLKQAGLVDWTTMAGSLHVVDAVAPDPAAGLAPLSEAEVAITDPAVAETDDWATALDALEASPLDATDGHAVELDASERVAGDDDVRQPAPPKPRGRPRTKG